jgi:hypothetical protein
MEPAAVRALLQEELASVAVDAVCSELGIDRATQHSCAVILAGPMCAGKSSVQWQRIAVAEWQRRADAAKDRDRCCAETSGHASFVAIDGDIIRSSHPGWIEHQLDTTRVPEAHEIAKPPISRAKDTVFRRFLERRLDFALPLTFSTPADQCRVETLRLEGYSLFAIAFIPSLQAARARAVERAQQHGRLQSLSASKYCACVSAAMKVACETRGFVLATCGAACALWVDMGMTCTDISHLGIRAWIIVTPDDWERHIVQIGAWQERVTAAADDLPD